MKRILLVILVVPQIASASFFEERYRGWFWFEKEEVLEKITPEFANNVIEEMRTELDSRRNVMIVSPTAENVVEYIKLEEKMWERALALDAAFREAKLRFPEYFDKLSNPTNVRAVKIKRQEEKLLHDRKIKAFAAKYDLVYFSKENCEYSKGFAKVLRDFGNEFDFNIEEASLEGEVSGFFKGGNFPELAKKLNIKVTPSVFAIAKDKKQAFEMTRGYLSRSELEEYAYLASNYADI